METTGDFSLKKDWYTLVFSLLIVTLHFPNSDFISDGSRMATGTADFITSWTNTVVLFAILVFL
ncbi:MAG: hypothetical protein RSD08_04870 [Oscillospiraceae bacterium]